MAPMSESSLTSRYRSVQHRIADAAARSGRAPGDVQLVAVTKYAEAEDVAALVELGHRDFGESRAQALDERAGRLEAGADPPVRWHMLGTLQRRRAAGVAELAHLVHSVDTVRIAEALGSAARRAGRTLDVLLQVNTSGESTKSGLLIPAVEPVVEQLAPIPGLRLRGLMTMAPHTGDPEATRPIFARTAEIFADCRAGGAAGADFNLLSMGMSHDFEVAIETGANIVRIGSAIFG